ncbi:MAG: type II toxin-antitoxin system RelE/ParE family toxin [Pirellulales bacterium]|nr:type II toxin-antitoxin system RelE/ParE family toxin [Pirellulales bacterium]
MNVVRITPLAERDMDEILDYISLDNPESALRVIRRIRKKCESLGDHPYLGQRRPEYADGQYRSTTVGSYVIYYSVEEDEEVVKVVRVLHGARDHSRLL